MKRYILCSVFLLAVLCFSSCHSSKSRVDDLKEFVEQVLEKGQDYTQDQWTEANERFGQLLEKINSYDDLSQEELEEVAKLQGQYAAAVFKSCGKSIMEQMEKAGAAWESFGEGLEEGLENQQDNN